ncbi:MAG: hypothetical protein A4E53_00560 [Pelotomaculum sp. PtaB.Bin104]|nr:MAG: hypothetical protein A4E53_00560 [Pelotomaculum sp. PtaB.Bin104]OPY61999.1 MAG: hypothetical protein A4E56_01624 [Pelotomaculum sp. PtaU1.Bin065]
MYKRVRLYVAARVDMQISPTLAIQPCAYSPSFQKSNVNRGTAGLKAICFASTISPKWAGLTQSSGYIGIFEGRFHLKRVVIQTNKPKIENPVPLI